MNVYDLLTKHEGLKLTAYTCPAGYITIGVGRNLETNGITQAEAIYLLQNDVSRLYLALINKYPWFEGLSEARQAVIVSMAFNLGMQGLAEFKKFLKAVEKQDFAEAAKEMKASQWATQVDHRSTELSQMLLEDKFLEVG